MVVRRALASVCLSNFALEPASVPQTTNAATAMPALVIFATGQLADANGRIPPLLVMTVMPALMMCVTFVLDAATLRYLQITATTKASVPTISAIMSWVASIRIFPALMITYARWTFATLSAVVVVL